MDVCAFVFFFHSAFIIRDSVELFGYQYNSSLISIGPSIKITSSYDWLVTVSSDNIFWLSYTLGQQLHCGCRTTGIGLGTSQGSSSNSCFLWRKCTIFSRISVSRNQKTHHRTQTQGKKNGLNPNKTSVEEGRVAIHLRTAGLSDSRVKFGL